MKRIGYIEKSHLVAKLLSQKATENCELHVVSDTADIEAVDAVIGLTDYSSRSAAIVCEQQKLLGPSLEAVLACQHKYISRERQQECIPEYIPQFTQSFDKEIQWPAIVKPVMSHFSQFTMPVESAVEAWQFIQENQQQMSTRNRTTYADIIEKVGDYGVDTFIIEEYVAGVQFTIEGYMFQGECTWIGATDSIFLPDTLSFDRFEFPSSVNSIVLKRAKKAIEIFLHHVGFDNGAFNVECIYSVEEDRIVIVECNSRTALQFHWLYEAVLGIDMGKVIVDIACGIDPHSTQEWSNSRERSSVAVCGIVRQATDGILRNAYVSQNQQWVEQEYGHAYYKNIAFVNKPLSALRQDSFTYRYANVYFTSKNRQEIDVTWRAIQRGIQVDIEAI